MIFESLIKRHIRYPELEFHKSTKTVQNNNHDKKGKKSQPNSRLELLAFNTDGRSENIQPRSIKPKRTTNYKSNIPNFYFTQSNFFNNAIHFKIQMIKREYIS